MLTSKIEDGKKTKKNVSNDISFLVEEYGLKRNVFNPKKPSPNKFCSKLEFRMKHYYNYLYTLSSSPPK